ncbi:hypothetical protein BDR26DRAFT_929667 [Obelidium mucronatum]|nr:hypothetical protein BDR26DRAFT_929667 [Obelidium mucronatum]
MPDRAKTSPLATRLQPLKTKLEYKGSIAFKDAMELVEEITHLLMLTHVKGEGKLKQPKSMGKDKAAKAQQFKQKFKDQGESSTANKKAKLECVLCPGMTNHATKNCFDYKNFAVGPKPTAKKAVGGNNKKGPNGSLKCSLGAIGLPLQ